MSIQSGVEGFIHARLHSKEAQTALEHIRSQSGKYWEGKKSLSVHLNQAVVDYQKKHFPKGKRKAKKT